MQSRFLHIDDTKTWDAFRHGNHAAFAYIYQTSFQELYNYGRKFCKDDALIGDVLQELFTGLWQKRKRLGSTDHIKNYLYRSFRRALIRKLQKQKKNNTLTDTNFSFEISFSHEAQLIQRELDAEQFETLKLAINSLTDKQREIIFLKFYDGLSYAEISEITNLSTTQIYDFMYKALRSLRKNIKKGGADTSLSSSAISTITIIMICNIFSTYFC